MSLDIFTTTFSDEYEKTIRAVRFTLLQKLAGENASKFACLAPISHGQPMARTLEHRKAEWVELCIQLLVAGLDASTLPSACSCSQLAGSLCDMSNAGFNEILDTIAAYTPPVP